MKKISIIAAILAFAPALALASTTTLDTPALAKIGANTLNIPASFVSSPTPPAGFYIHTQRLNPAHIQQDVDNYGAAAIRFVPPPAVNAPIKVVTRCGPFKYTYTYAQHAKNRRQIWENTNGKAMSEKMINSCQRARGTLTVRFSPVVKKHVAPAGARFAARAAGVPAALITPDAPAPGGLYVTAARELTNPFRQGVRFIVRFF